MNYAIAITQTRRKRRRKIHFFQLRRAPPWTLVVNVMRHFNLSLAPYYTVSWFSILVISFLFLVDD